MKQIERKKYNIKYNLFMYKSKVKTEKLVGCVI
jgi:hypothetical protein